MIISFQCKTTAKTKYAFSYIKQILKAMVYATKISISTGESGLLGLQLLINNEDHQMFVEYYVTSMFEGN